jgi:hypothetical protein
MEGIWTADLGTGFLLNYVQFPIHNVRPVNPKLSSEPNR